MLQLATDAKVPIGHTFINFQKSHLIVLIKENWFGSLGKYIWPSGSFRYTFLSFFRLQSLEVQRSCRSCSWRGQRACPFLEGCTLLGCYTHVLELAWQKNTIHFRASILQFRPSFSQNIIRMSWQPAPNFCFAKGAGPDQITFGFPVTSLARFYGWLMLKAATMFELEGLKPRVFILHGELFICVWFTTVHG